MDNNKTIPLSPEQRDLLLKYEPYFASHELFRMVSIAVKKGKNYEIYLTKEQLEDLCDQIFTISEKEDDEKQEAQRQEEGCPAI